MHLLKVSLLALSISLAISAAHAAPSSGSPIRDLTVTYNCLGSQPDTSRWMIQGESQDQHWVRFESKSDPTLIVYSGVLFIQVPSLQDDKPPRDIELGHVLGPAACNPADDGSGYGNSFVPAFLEVMLDEDVSLSIVAGAQPCLPGYPNYGTLDTLVVDVDGATYAVQPSSCD